MKRVSIVSVLLVFAGGLAGGTAWAADQSPPAWRITFTPYLWAAGVSGDVTVKGRTASVDASFVDILENTDSLIGLQGHLEVARGPLGGYADLTWLEMGIDEPGPTNAELTSKMWLVEFGAQYRVLDTTGGKGRGVALDAYAGGRFTSLELELEARGGGTFSRTKSWIDPVIGARATFGLTEHLLLVVGGDVGGFGAGSDFAWSALGLLGYRWQGAGIEWAVLAGYRALGQDYSSGSGAQRFRWDTTMHGPIAGLSMRF